MVDINADLDFSTSSLVVPIEGKQFSIVNPCADYVFKKVFDTSSILVDFLNKILGYTGENEIVELSYLNQELKSHISIGRGFVVDIACKTENDKYFIIEMQNNYGSDYADKIYMEFSRFLARIDLQRIDDLLVERNKKRRIGHTDVEAKDFWKKINEVCAIFISNKLIDPNAMKDGFTNEPVAEPDVINTYEMLCNKNPARHLGNIKAKVVLVMLANFNKTVNDLENDADRWLFAFKDTRLASSNIKMEMYKVIPDISKAAGESRPLLEFYKKLHVQNINRNVLEKINSDIIEWDSNLSDIMNEGIAIGDRNAVRRCKSKGMQTEAICELLEFKEEFVNSVA